MPNQIILVRPTSNVGYGKWLTVTDNDLDAINRVDEMFDCFFTDNHDVWILTGYAEFLDWMKVPADSDLENLDVYQFEAYVRGQIDFLFSPQENEDIISRLINWFMSYEAEKQKNSQPVENVIALNGKRYKLVELT
jgi:hypothetical protein